MALDEQHLQELLYQAFETEIGGEQIYAAALGCAQNDELREEWEQYHEQTTRHVELMREVLEAFGLDPETETPGRQVVRCIGESLVKAIELAQANAGPDDAEVVAAECVTLAETKDHLNWELVGEVLGQVRGEPAKVLQAAHEEVEEQEDEHLYHNTGWARELWIKGLGLRAVLPPPEEQKDVKTAIGAARAKKARRQMA